MQINWGCPGFSYAHRIPVSESVVMPRSLAQRAFCMPQQSCSWQDIAGEFHATLIPGWLPRVTAYLTPESPVYILLLGPPPHPHPIPIWVGFLGLDPWYSLVSLSLAIIITWGSYFTECLFSEVDIQDTV